jgi:NAD(P)-dependent dehydrogenase (short-subunit alcohol dehydrogenase family)
VKRFLSEGAIVVAFDIQPLSDEKSQQLTELSGGSQFQFHQVDTTDELAVDQLVEGMAAEFWRVDILANVAGVLTHSADVDPSLEEWDRVMAINAKGPFIVSKAVIRQMRKQQQGSIVSVASIQGINAFEFQPAYGASKAAIIQLTKNFATDYAQDNIRVNCVCPGMVATEAIEVVMMPEFKEIHDTMAAKHLMNRFAQPEEIAAGICFLASDDASFITGEALVIDGGYTVGRKMS